MPIRPDQRSFYPIDWPELSRTIRFERALGQCEQCGRPHGKHVWNLGAELYSGKAGLWWNEADGTWQCSAGRKVRMAPLDEVRRKAKRQGLLWPGSDGESWGDTGTGLRQGLVILACCHLDHDPFNNAPSNLAALCQRCHLRHDAIDNAMRRRTNRWLRLTSGMKRLGF